MPEMSQCQRQQCGDTFSALLLYCPKCRWLSCSDSTFPVLLISTWAVVTYVLIVLGAVIAQATPRYVEAFLYFVIAVATSFAWQSAHSIRVVGLAFLAAAVLLTKLNIYLSLYDYALVFILLASVSVAFSSAVEHRWATLAVLTLALVVVEERWIERTGILGQPQRSVSENMWSPQHLILLLVGVSITRCVILGVVAFLVHGVWVSRSVVLFKRLWALSPARFGFFTPVELSKRESNVLFLGPVITFAMFCIGLAVGMGEKIIQVGRYAGYWSLRVGAIFAEFVLRVAWYFVRLFGRATLSAVIRIGQGLWGGINILTSVIVSVGIPFALCMCLVSVVAQASAFIISAVYSSKIPITAWASSLGAFALVVVWLRNGAWILYPGERSLWWGNAVGPRLMLEDNVTGHWRTAKIRAWNVIENYLVHRVLLASLILLTLCELLVPRLVPLGVLPANVTPLRLGYTGGLTLILMGIGLVVEIVNWIRTFRFA